ncbi:MAG: DUF1638 domain-containing protein, partial [bacterium]|nr:DUF1638 domain-containing protein [bacterium]
AAAVAESEDLHEVCFVTFPAHCGDPKKSWTTLADRLRECKEALADVLIVGGCSARMGDPPEEWKTCHVHATEQCFHLVTSRELVDAYLREGSHLLTPGWLARWRDHIDEWGFSRETARDFFAESTTQLVLLDTGIDENARRHLKEFSEFVGLPSQVVPVGLGSFRSFLMEIVQEWRLAQERRKLAEYAMVFDILSSLPHARTETAVISRIMDLFQALCAPASLVYVPFTGGKAGDPQSTAASSFTEEAVKRRLTLLDKTHAWSESEDGFLVKIVHQDEVVGGLEIEGLAFPQYKDHYLNLTLTVLAACGLAIANARANDEIARAVEKREVLINELQEAMDDIRTLRGIVPICAHCKNVRNDKGFWERVETYVRDNTEAEFSHGICPECRKELYPELEGEQTSTPLLSEEPCAQD